MEQPSVGWIVPYDTEQHGGTWHWPERTAKPLDDEHQDDGVDHRAVVYEHIKRTYPHVDPVTGRQHPTNQ